MTFPYLHLRFDLHALAPLKLGGYQAGERLRDALAQVILQAVCPENPRKEKPDPAHAAVCPACWLLSAETDPGMVRRAYSLVPPLPPVDVLPAGGKFSFVLTLYGDGLRFLPYFVLAVPEMGRVGVGPGRGAFALDAVWGLQPLLGARFPLLLPGEQVVRPPAAAPAADVFKLAEGIRLPSELRIHFLTPTRLVDKDQLVKQPPFTVFFRRMLERIDALAGQYAGAGRRPPEQVRQLYDLAEEVNTTQANLTWTDLWGPSSRTGRVTPMGGFTGSAVYRAQDWSPLLPWLLLGQGAQVGKLAAKGNGVFELDLPGRPAYWQFCFSQVEGQIH